MSKITMLTNADIRKVDLVPAGAQQLSKISIMKGGQTPMNDKVNKLSDEELNEIQSLLDEIKAKLDIKEDDESENKDDVKDGVEESKDIDKECGVDKVEGECENKTDVKDNVEESKDLEKKEEPEVVDDKGENKTDVKDNVEESKDDEVKEALKKAADAQAENDKLKDQIAKMEDERTTKEFIQKASELGNIPGISTNELGSVLKVINKSVDADTYKKIEALLKSANDTIGSGSLFVEKGTSAQSSGEPTTADEAWQMIEKMAQSRVEKGISNTNNCISDILDTPAGANLYSQYKMLRGGN